MYNKTSITAAALLQEIVNEEIITPERITTLLGVDRKSVTLKHLEMALLRENLIADSHLSKLKGKIANLPHVASSNLQTSSKISKEVSLETGAVVLEAPVLTVAMVEDTPLNVNLLCKVLNVTRFEIHLCTAKQFIDLHRACYSSVQVESYPSAEDIFEILDEAVRRGASDIHLSVGQPPILRVDGRLLPLKLQPIDSNWMKIELTRLAGPVFVERAEREYNADLAYSYGASRFRLNLGADRAGLTLSARKLPTKIPTLDELALPSSIRSFTGLDRGLVLVTGPTGSGKSTTLAALLNSIALNQARHIITLEDPIEFHLQQGQSMVNQRELHESFDSFPGGLRQALRQDPDVILVGEMRDLDTIRTAVTAAETGHLVFGTLHTFDASSTVGRIVSSFPPEEQTQVRQQLAYILKGIVSQTLVPSITGKGRLAAFEIMLSTPAVASNLRKVDGHNSLKNSLETGTRYGMQTMDMALASLVKQGLVTREDAEEKIRDSESFKAALNTGN